MSPLFKIPYVNIPQHLDICNIKLLLSHCYHSVCNENIKYIKRLIMLFAIIGAR